ncbi:hypothetical protein K461DRAFT_253492 [Myriangium duriaei CBS 260.36]|uniref:Arrestin-like N-terminal domain-containing protein n=1 Tax=Myriangium duriaei CBS 260.36 TaxID=1168546 RepID=A0A9P4J4H5_9PEZI|nr:hypothetical protein K461DRAFT_253492 [Myriangium duriaei CBS 260.36]
MSSYASSISSAEATATTIKTTNGNTVAAKIKAMAQKTRPQIKISLDGYEDSWVATYSTLDRIEGKVSITCPTKTSIDNFSIDFIGTTKTYLERLTSSTTVSGRSEARHQFLKLTQPIPGSAWPEGKLLEAGKTYEFGFLFVVPQQLLPRVCRHTITSAAVQHEHLKLPPSFGDKSVAGRGRHLLDDIAPDMARIKYCVSVTLRESPKHENIPEQPIEKTKLVRILPAVEENPPMDTEGPDCDYVLRHEKDIRKGVFKGKLGRLVIEAAQPKAMCIPSYKSEDQTPESTMVTVNLRFDPADSKSSAPKLGYLNSKLKVSSFFSSSARAKLPTKKDTQWDLNQGLHSETLNLASRCLGNVEWTFNKDDDAISRDRRHSSAASSLSDLGAVPEASKKYKGEGFWTAKLVVPISLPMNKAWIPTFHTCLVSRTYSLGIHLSVPTGGIGSGMDLKLPLQLTSEGNLESLRSTRNSLSLQEQAVEAMEADDFFAPRTVSPIDATYVGRSNIGPVTELAADLPPQYDSFARSGTQRIAVV